MGKKFKTKFSSLKKFRLNHFFSGEKPSLLKKKNGPPPPPPNKFPPFLGELRED